METIRIGFEVDTGDEVRIPIGHAIWTGVSQNSGKTTGIETVSKRSGKNTIAFITKIGEESFQNDNKIKPFYRERSDWEFIRGLIESMEKIRIRGPEQAKIIQLTRQSGGNSLLEFKKKLDEKLLNTKSMTALDIYTNLHAYLEKIIPKIYEMDYSKELSLSDGVNVIDLEKFSMDAEIQGLIIASVLDEVLTRKSNTIVAIPELWKFSPQERGTPCKHSIESFARQGAANGNYLFLDSQEMASTDKGPLKQCLVWIMGYQAEKNEVKHTLDQLPIPKKKRPTEDEIMSLKTGEFFVATRDMVKKVFVQAWWVSESDARDVALGKKSIKDLPKRPSRQKLAKYEPEQPRIEIESMISVDKHLQMPERITQLSDELYKLNTRFSSFQREVFEKLNLCDSKIDKEELINEIINRIPKGGNVVYTVSPLEKIRKDFIVDAKNKIIDDISKLSDKAKQMLKYLETRQAGVSTSEICIKCFLMKSGEGGYAKQVKDYGNEIMAINLAQKQTNGNIKGMLKDKIDELIRIHGATDQDINLLYDHVLYELLTPKSKGEISK